MRWLGTVALGLLLGSATPTTAQTSAEGSIRGTVKDAQGAVLPGVTITATSPDAAGTYTAVTDAGGEYRLLGIPAGRFTIVAELEGFAKYVRDGIVARAGLNLQVDVTMQLGAVSEVVKVEAETPLLETRTAARAINISGELQRALPLASRRNWSDFLNLVPGVTISTQTAEFYFVRGANLDEHVIRVDGVSIDSGQQGGNTFIKFNTDALLDVQIKTAGADAAAPLGQGAIIDVATPSGTNQPRGAVTIAYQDKSWNDRNTLGGVSASRQLQTDVSAGGPIRRDHAWLFGAYRYQDRRTGVSRTPLELGRLEALVPGFQPIDSENRAHYWFAKTTLRLGDRHQAYAWYQYDQNADNRVGSTEAALFLERPQGGGAAAGRLTSVWTSTLTSQVLYSHTNKPSDRRVIRNDVPGRVVHATSFLASGARTGSGMIALLDNDNNPETLADYPKTSVVADLTHHRRGPFGSHELQGGLYWQFIDGLTQQRFFNSGFIVEDLVLANPNDSSAGARPFHRRIYDQATNETFRGTSSNLAFYVQDVWRPRSRLTLNLGIRADLIRQRDDIFGVETVSSVEVGPRVGINYLLTSDARNAASASWARVSSGLARTRLTVGTSAAGFRDFYDTDLDGTFETVFTNPASTAQSRNQLIDPDYHQPYADEWTVGYRRQFAGQVAANATFVRREYRDRPTSIEVNGIYEGGVFRGYRDESQRDILLRANNRWNWPVCSTLELEASKQSSRVQLLANYTRQWRHLAGTWQPNDPVSFLQPEAFSNDKGIDPTHATDSSFAPGGRPNWRDHVGKVAIAYQAPWAVRLATHYQVQSGHWSSAILMRLPGPDPRFGPQTVRLSNGVVVPNPLATPLRLAFPTRSEGQFTSPTLHFWNIRVGREFAFGRTRLAADLDLFNVTNRGDFETLATNAHQIDHPNYRLGTLAQSPRAAQITLRFAY